MHLRTERSEVRILPGAPYKKINANNNCYWLIFRYNFKVPKDLFFEASALEEFLIHELKGLAADNVTGKRT